jgi:hypothetical protein
VSRRGLRAFSAVELCDHHPLGKSASASTEALASALSACSFGDDFPAAAETDDSTKPIESPTQSKVFRRVRRIDMYKPPGTFGDAESYASV